MDVRSNDYHREYLKRRYDERWPMAIALLGGKCSICGSRENLEFDHIDPRTKQFEISDRIAQLSWHKIIDELKKCQLLCFDCHVDKSKIDMMRRRVANGRKSTVHPE